MCGRAGSAIAPFSTEHFVIWDLACDLDDALGSPPLQEGIGIPAWELPRHTSHTAVLESHEKIAGQHNRSVFNFVREFRSKPVCIHEGARIARCRCLYAAYVGARISEGGGKFAIDYPDVSGAFDRVNRERLLEKLRAKGIHPDLIRVIGSWLLKRAARVVVGGVSGAAMELRNMVYQGTVWGPWLWNVFYEDARLAVQEALFEEIVYADDLNAFRESTLRVPNRVLFSPTKRCQQRLHTWGRANQVQFDPDKESHHVVSHVTPEGSDFKILGILFDCGLTMAAAVHELVGECRWKIQALMKVSRFHTVLEMIGLCKFRCSPLSNAGHPAYHACDLGWHSGKFS